MTARPLEAAGVDAGKYLLPGLQTWPVHLYFLWQWRLLRTAFRDRGASCLVWASQNTCDRKSFGILFFGFIFHHYNGWCHMSIFSLPRWSLQLRCGTGTAVALMGTEGADPPPA